MPPPPDWTTGPAKWAAVALLGVASIAGMAWSLGREPRTTVLAAPAPIPPEPAPEVAPARAPDAAEAAPVEPPAAPSAPPSAVRLININTASAAELELLPGIGPALASRIIEYRKTSGPFRRVDDLDEVKGIGARTLEKLRPLIRVE